MGLWSSKEARTESTIAKIVHKALGSNSKIPEWAIKNEIFSFKDLRAALKEAGLESSNLILGIDFTASNKTQGSSSFGGKCLHAISKSEKNPYELVLEMIWNSISDFDDNGEISMFAFGDTVTRHQSVKPIGDGPCKGIDQALSEYRAAAKTLRLSGPTSFAPLIRQAIQVVQHSGGQYHILLIIGDGGVSHELDCLRDSCRALVEASSHPLSVVMVGVGDGPWDAMRDLDDGIARRRFDNFQFIPFAPFQALLAARGGGGDAAADRSAVECAFAVAALQEIPAQYATIRSLRLLGHGITGAGAGAGAAGKRAAEAAEVSPSKARRLE